MHPDLVVTAYRHQERELEQRLHRRRVALERAASVSPAPVSAHRPALTVARTTARRVISSLHRSRQAVVDAYAPSDCCAAA